MSMRTTIEFGSADLLIATQANIFPRTFSVGAPHVVVTSTSGSVRPIAIAASNPVGLAVIRRLRALGFGLGLWATDAVLPQSWEGARRTSSTTAARSAWHHPGTRRRHRETPRRRYREC